MFHLGKKRNFIVQINKNEIKEFTLQNKYPQMLGTIFTCNCSYRQALHTNCIDISSYLIDLNVLGIELFDMYEFVRLYIYEKLLDMFIYTVRYLSGFNIKFRRI